MGKYEGSFRISGQLPESDCPTDHFPDKIFSWTKKIKRKFKTKNSALQKPPDTHLPDKTFFGIFFLTEKTVGPCTVGEMSSVKKTSAKCLVGKMACQRNGFGLLTRNHFGFLMFERFHLIRLKF